MIRSSQISVVVQGPIVGKPGDAYKHRLTLQSLESVRRHLPEAELILSTWKDSDVSNLPFDVLVESDDPGGVQFFEERSEHRIFNNVNRQITSTRAGLQSVKRDYAVKLRGDTILTGTGFTQYFGKYKSRCTEWRILRERTVTSTVYARNPRLARPFPFHPSDMFFFGHSEDVINIWDIPLAPEPETSRWFETRPRPVPDTDPGTLNRYVPEQYVWLTFLRKYGEVQCEHKSDLNHNAIDVSEQTIVNNLVVVEPAKLQIKFLKFPLTRQDWWSLYSHGDWLRLYKRYCDPAFNLPPDLVAWQKKASAFSYPFWRRLPLAPLRKLRSIYRQL